MHTKRCNERLETRASAAMEDFREYGGNEKWTFFVSRPKLERCNGVTPGVIFNIPNNESYIQRDVCTSHGTDGWPVRPSMADSLQTIWSNFSL